MTNDNTETKSDVTEKLLKIAADYANLAPAEVLQYISRPDWKPTKGWQWEMYVDQALRELWGLLEAETMLAVFIMANSRILEAQTGYGND